MKDFSLGVVAHHIPFPCYRLFPSDFAQMKDAGLSAIEVDLTWRLIEPEPDVFDFSFYDELVAQARAHGIKLLAKIGNGYNGSRPTVPDWLLSLSNEEYLLHLERYARRTALRYREDVLAFALENEANISHWHVGGGWRQGEWGEERVLSLWSTLAKAIGEAAPGVERVLSLAAVEDWPRWVLMAQERLLFEALGLQIYPCIAGPEPERALEAKEAFAQALALCPALWVLETGYHTFGRTEEDQARFVEIMARCARDSGAKGVFFYEYLDGPEEPDLPIPDFGQERCFGLVRNMGDEGSHVPKPAWEALCRAAKTTAL